jgi:RNA polymerase sigma factor (sigma-70 family)
MKPEPTVFVVDDDASVCDSLRCLLESAGFAVETYGAAEEFLCNVGSTRRGCLLLDMRMPGMDGLQLQRHMAEHRMYLPIIILTAYADVPMAVKALQGGAVDFVEKPYEEEDLIRRIEAAIARDIQVNWDEAEQAAVKARLAALTEREREVLNLIVAGKWVKLIAAELGTSPNTVRNQQTRIMEKMQAECVADLVRMVMIAQLGPQSPARNSGSPSSADRPR